MKVNLDYSQLTVEAAKARHPTLEPDLWKAVRVASFELEKKVKDRMPVDTGRARASWGHSRPPAGAGDGVWDEDRDGLAITQGSTVEYIPYLNEGHSQQAPAGFIDASVQEAAVLLESLIDEVMEGRTL